MTPKAAMIFAAGFGTRMRPLTNSIPKPMISVCGRPMIDYAIDYAKEVGASPIVSNLHYMPEVLKTHLENRGVDTVLEASGILETGGGLRNALPALGEGPVWTLNPDVVWSGPNPLAFANKHWDSEKMDALVVCISATSAKGTSSNGDFLLDCDGRVQRGPGAIFAGAQIINPAGLSAIDHHSFSLNVFWDMLIDKQRLYACLYPGTWCDVGTLDGLREAERLIKRADYD